MKKLIKKNKSKNTKFNLFVIKTSKTGSNISSSRLCERCVLAVNEYKKLGVKINKIYYSNNDGSLTKISPTALLSCNDHHVTKFFKNNNYSPTLGCCCGCEVDQEDS